MRLLFLALLSVVPSNLAAREFRSNPTRPIDRTAETELLPIGELEDLNAGQDKKTGNTLTNYGTGILVSPCYVLTNHHVIFGKDLHLVEGKSYHMRFHVGVGSKPGEFYGNTSAVPIIWGNRQPNGMNDWALLKLATCVGAPKFNFGWFDALSRMDGGQPGESVAAIGFPTDQQLGVLTGSFGRLEGIDQGNGLFMISASMAHGQSGGGLFVYRDESIYLVGLLTRAKNEGLSGVAGEYKSDLANEALDVGPILDRPDIKKLLDDDKAAVGNDNRNRPRLRKPLMSIRTMAPARTQ